MKIILQPGDTLIVQSGEDHIVIESQYARNDDGYQVKQVTTDVKMTTPHDGISYTTFYPEAEGRKTCGMQSLIYVHPSKDDFDGNWGEGAQA